VRWDARAHRIREIEEALAPACDRLPREEAERATAVIVYLANALAWLSLRDESGLDGHRSSAAITWAIDTLVADLDRRKPACRERTTRRLSVRSASRTAADVDGRVKQLVKRTTTHWAERRRMNELQDHF
jgi:hypothetical protein